MLGDLTCFPYKWHDMDLKRMDYDEKNLDDYFDIVSDREKMYEEFFSRMKDVGGVDMSNK